MHFSRISPRRSMYLSCFEFLKRRACCCWWFFAVSALLIRIRIACQCVAHFSFHQQHGNHENLVTTANTLLLVLFSELTYSAWTKCDRHKGFLQNYSRSLPPLIHSYICSFRCQFSNDVFRIVISLLFILFVQYSINLMRMSCCMCLLFVSLIPYWMREKKVLLTIMLLYKRTRWLLPQKLEKQHTCKIIHVINTFCTFLFQYYILLDIN